MMWQKPNYNQKVICSAQWAENKGENGVKQEHEDTVSHSL